MRLFLVPKNRHLGILCKNYWADSHQIFTVCRVQLYALIANVIREYARGRRERRNRIRPADVAFFSSESDKNVALIFRKIRCFNIHFKIHTCHQQVFDLGRSSTRYPSDLGPITCQCNRLQLQLLSKIMITDYNYNYIFSQCN